MRGDGSTGSADDVTVSGTTTVDEDECGGEEEGEGGGEGGGGLFYLSMTYLPAPEVSNILSFLVFSTIFIRIIIYNLKQDDC